MGLVQLQDDEYRQQPASPLKLFPLRPQVCNNDLQALSTDFFDWLERAWQLPIYGPPIDRASLPIPLTLSEELYTVPDLSHLYGYNVEAIYRMLKHEGISPNQMGEQRSCSLYSKQDLAFLIESWEQKRLLRALDQWWLRFFAPACGTCRSCQKNEHIPFTQQFFCSSNETLTRLRRAFAQFLEEILQAGSIVAWWHKHDKSVWNYHLCSAWGTILIYLLDRRLLHLSNDELLQLAPICNKSHHELTRLWRHRRPEEYNQLLNAIKAANYRNVGLKELALSLLSVLVLFKYGLPGITELRRPLSPEELQQVCNERRLVTTHLGYGVFLPYPLTADIRVGHVILDDIRFYFWNYAARQEQIPGKQRWDKGPRHWSQMLPRLLEQALAAPVYDEGTAILSRRPETEQRLVSPWHILHEGKLANNSYALLPGTIQEQLMIYLTYLHQEEQVELMTLRGKLTALMHFFNWARVHGKLVNYPHWSRKPAQEIFRAYHSTGNYGTKAATRQHRFKDLAHFFSTLAGLEYPAPTGYHLLYQLEKGDTGSQRAVPSEAILDRVFRDGVCHLAYDPFARLALTIQYFCGTRSTETCELHLFCILEDRNGHAYLLIPRGKNKEERPFPIVELGMGPLLEYMDEVVSLRLSPDGASRTLGKTNFRYRNDDPERAKDWHYLFDRVPSEVVKRRGRLSRARLEIALQEALLMAAKINPDGLFQGETYNSTCQHRRRKGQYCYYFAARQGITTCPCCGSSLSGQRGVRCRSILKENFICDGIAQNGEAFCPKCDTPLAKFLPITPHVFRHNSVSRAHRAGVPVTQNMKLHGHNTLPMHLRYLHLLLEDTTDEVRKIFAVKRLREVRQALGSAPGQIVEGGIAYTISLEQYLGLTLQRTLKRRTYGIWGGFWAGALAQRGVASPLSVEDEIVIPEDTYEHTIAQYWYEALGLAVSEVAFELITNGKWRAEVPSFLDRQKIEKLVQFHLCHIQDSIKSALGQQLMETDILEQRRFLDDLAEKLRPWWQHQGSIDQLVEMFAPGGGHAFQKQLSPAEPAP